MSKYACKDCGEILKKDLDKSAGERKPCPKCGSIKRLIPLSAKVELSIHGQAELSVLLGATVPPILLQTVLEKGEITDEGQIILAVSLPWLEIVKFIENDPSHAYQIKPRVWEEIIAGAYVKAGFDEVVLTPQSGDRGRDIIAVKKGLGQIRVIDQVKAYKPTHKVTADDVRALVGVLEMDRASKGFLTTTSDFAPQLSEDPLIKRLIPNRIELINGEMLNNRLIELSKKF